MVSNNLDIPDSPTSSTTNSLNFYNNINGTKSFAEIKTDTENCQPKLADAFYNLPIQTPPTASTPDNTIGSQLSVSLPSILSSTSLELTSNAASTNGNSPTNILPNSVVIPSSEFSRGASNSPASAPAVLFDFTLASTGQVESTATIGALLKSRKSKASPPDTNQISSPKRPRSEMSKCTKWRDQKDNETNELWSMVEHINVEDKSLRMRVIENVAILKHNRIKEPCNRYQDYLHLQELTESSMAQMDTLKNDKDKKKNKKKTYSKDLEALKKNMEKVLKMRKELLENLEKQVNAINQKSI